MTTAAQAFSQSADAYAETMVPVLRAVANDVVRHAQLQPGARVLDVGTGTGIAAAAASGDGRTVVGLDAAPGMLEIARRDHPAIEFVEGDMMRLPFDDASFDAVVSVHALLFADDPVVALGEMLRVARPGAMLSLSVPGPHELSPRAALTPVYERFGIDLPSVRRDEDTLRRWAGAAGWTDIQTAADPTVVIRLPDEATVRRWLHVGPSGVALGSWTDDRLDTFTAAIMDDAPRGDDGVITLPFGALFLRARRGS